MRALRRKKNSQVADHKAQDMKLAWGSVEEDGIRSAALCRLVTTNNPFDIKHTWLSKPLSVSKY